ncbi:MAG: thiamine pyrophosphate-dependent dehydrogenase E1 component subunit alpha [Candidatus Accumulibacter sp.]|jgi:pyruvate dehydrogenase E1 component alpha subunit|nr:thiamine pyrophosphate-dependent dehydrogenase E1 component subunit alpha [Accumulibacter sp.]
MMLLIRRFEEKLTDLSKDPRRIGGMMIVCTGQEAVAAGVGAALSPEDVIITNHRSHGHLLAKGAEPDLIMAEIFGRRTGYNKGKSGTLHIAAPEVNALCTTTVVGGNIPIAVGMAFAAQYTGKNYVTVCFFGDGATDEGSFHEALNLASLWNLPVIFACENNVYAGAQRMEEHTRVRDIADRAASYAMRAEKVDGNDALAVFEAMRKARTDCLSGAGPLLIEFKTYRWGGHNTTDAQIYQPQDEIALWKERCPIGKLKASLMEAGALAEEEYRRFESEAGEKVEQALRFAEASPWPEPAEALEDVFV